MIICWYYRSRVQNDICALVIKKMGDDAQADLPDFVKVENEAEAYRKALEISRENGSVKYFPQPPKLLINGLEFYD